MLTRLKDIPEVLCKYHKTIEEQLQQGITEGRNKAKPNEGRIIRYLPHQPGNHGTLLCKARIGNANIPSKIQEPALVVPNTPLAEMLVHEAHLPYHCSTSQTIANLRRRFWIPSLRQMARKADRKCLPCRRMNNLPYKYRDMDDLPAARVRRTRPFDHVGLDYFGLLTTKLNETSTKAYGIILTCTRTRLLHLELVRDISTKGLLLA
ncbi:hypothetical protein DICVIV_12597 [Dictyocaulus viviparus]|uniref:Integrase zinc-binding domain-containing protein n=1 Tax=Dictyocaulus viviparus TaxID=29172 RepID=A0A0D8XCD2_DICVI|nr:hypothetical protein DICVIV_12597 [Dictyocaulus viviparus]